MTTAASKLDNLGDVQECTFCFEVFKSPRLLGCGHVFCEVCLKKLADGHPNGDIRCPTCRKETKLSSTYQVADLPRHVENEAKETKEIKRQIRLPPTGRPCDVCEEREAKASRRCQECAMNLCEQCFDNHQTVSAFSSHKTIPITESLFCGAHKSVEVSMYCENCKVGVCRSCVIKTHSKHSCKDVGVVADETRDKLKTFLDSLELTNNSIRMIPGLKSTASKLNEKRQLNVNNIQRLRDSLLSMIDHLNQVEAEIKLTVDTELGKLTKHETGLMELNASRTTFTKLARTLLQVESDIEVVVKGQGFPEVSTLKGYKSFSVTEPKIDGNLEDMRQVILNMMAKCIVRNQTSTIECKQPIGTLTKIREMTMVRKINGICLTEENGGKRIIMRTLDFPLPIKVYDYRGKFLREFDGGIGKLSDVCARDMSLDTKRELYLFPCNDKIIRCDKSGSNKDNIPVKGDLRSIVHINSEDVYVVAAMTQHKMSVINAETKQVIREFGSKGDGEYKSPWYMCLPDLGDTPGIVVSDVNNHILKMCDIRGHQITMYGTKGRGDGQLLSPWAVCTDPTGRLVVCDADNERLTTYWCEKGQQKWKCLLTKDQLGSWPRCVAIDVSERLLFVSTDDVKLLVYSCD